jgi:putative transposase
VVIAFIDAQRSRFGVEPVCRVLVSRAWRSPPITYSAAKTRPPSDRVLKDLRLVVGPPGFTAPGEIGRGLSGRRWQ